MRSKIAVLIFLLIFIISCDPGYHEEIKIHNKTSKTLPLRIVQDYESHYLSSFEYDNEIKFSVTKKDSIFLIEVNLLPDETFYIWNAGGIGKVSLITRSDGENRFKTICDSVYIDGCLLNKNIADFNQWNYYHDPDHTGGGETIFTFEITDSILTCNQ